LEKGIATCHVCGMGNMSFVGVIARATGRRPVTVLDEYCQRLGLPRPRRRVLTLADYAVAKQLPIDFLVERFALADSPEGIRMPYVGEDGALHGERVRKHLTAKPRWPKGTKASTKVYGLHGLPWIRATGSILVVEGESDLHTSWFHDLPALAMPGAAVGHRAMAKVVHEAAPHTVYLVPDSDSGGRAMLARMGNALHLVGWTGRALALRLPTKDLSDLHTAPDVDFSAVLNSCLNAAQPLAEVLERFDLQIAVEDRKMIKLLQAMLPNRELIGTDKAIVLAVALRGGADPTRPVLVTMQELARLAGVRRRTVHNRLPHIIHAGFLRREARGLCLGQGLVQ
jgi:hypothetical protein